MNIITDTSAVMYPTSFLILYTAVRQGEIVFVKHEGVKDSVFSCIKVRNVQKYETFPLEEKNLYQHCIHLTKKSPMFSVMKSMPYV